MISITLHGPKIYLIYPGSEKLDLGPKRPVAICTSETQANKFIEAMWPGLGYWEIAE